jgi:Mor family transcriptional regulator
VSASSPIPRSQVTDEERDAIVADYKAGVNFMELISKHKRGKSTIFTVLKRSGVTMRGKSSSALTRRTSRSSTRLGNKISAIRKRHSPLTVIESAGIVKDYKAGLLQEDICKKYRVGKDSIWRVVKAAGVSLRGKTSSKNAKRKYVKKAASWKKKASSSSGAPKNGKVTNGVVKFSKPGSMTASMFDELVREHHTAEQRAEAIENLFQHWPR